MFMSFISRVALGTIAIYLLPLGGPLTAYYTVKEQPTSPVLRRCGILTNRFPVKYLNTVFNWHINFISNG